MGAILKEIEEQALRSPLKERSELAHRLLVSFDGEPEDSPEAITRASDEEIARRVADIDAGRTKWILADAVMAKLHAKRGTRSAVEADLDVQVLKAPPLAAG